MERVAGLKVSDAHAALTISDLEAISLTQILLPLRHDLGESGGGDDGDDHTDALDATLAARLIMRVVPLVRSALAARRKSKTDAEGGANSMPGDGLGSSG